MQIKLKKLKCSKCEYEWHPRKTDVRQCPKCKTAYWDKEKEKE
jgi:predicted Zn-ribbon and HTH transcriptional regulator